jgi:hypothetical protein
MTNDEMINSAIKELNGCGKAYIMFKDLSFLKEVYEYDEGYTKIKYMLAIAAPFEKHGDHAIKFSKIGFEIINNYKSDWFIYKKSLIPKKDFTKIIAVIISFLSLCLTFYFGIRNQNLKDSYSDLSKENEKIASSFDSLKLQNTTLKDSVISLKSKLEAKVADP